MRDKYRVLLCLVKSNDEARLETKDSLLKLMMQQLADLQKQMIETLKNDANKSDRKNDLSGGHFHFGTTKASNLLDGETEDGSDAASASYLIAIGGSSPEQTGEGDALARETEHLANRILRDFDDAADAMLNKFRLENPLTIEHGKKAISSMQLNIIQFRATQAYAVETPPALHGESDATDDAAAPIYGIGAGDMKHVSQQNSRSTAHFFRKNGKRQINIKA